MDNSFEYNESYSHPYEIALNLTNDCNLACRYCFVEQKPDYMTLDVAIQSIEYLMENLRLHKEVFQDIEEDDKACLWFFGGEPLLCFYSIIKPLVEYCEKKDYLKNLIFTITTNGTLLDKEKADFLKKYHIEPMLSIDGDPETQNYNRPCKNKNIKSSELLEKNIPYILEVFPFILFRSTIYAPTADKMFENYLYAEHMGFKGISFTPDTRQTSWGKKEYNTMKDQLEKIFAYRLMQYHDNIFPIQYTDVTMTYKRILQHDINTALGNIYKPTYIHNCGIGVYMAAIDFKGDIYTCQERPSKNNKETFCLGNIYTGINLKQHQNFVESFINELQKNGFKSHRPEMCNTCLFQGECTRNCVSISQDLYHNFHTVNESFCMYHEILNKLCINLMDILVKEKNRTFYLDLYNNDAGEFGIFKDYMIEHYFSA